MKSNTKILTSIIIKGYIKLNFTPTLQYLRMVNDLDYFISLDREFHLSSLRYQVGGRTLLYYLWLYGCY